MSIESLYSEAHWPATVGTEPGGHELQAEDEHPHMHEGVFNFDSRLSEVEKKLDETRVDSNGNLLERYRLTFSDGVKLNANLYQSSMPVSDRLLLQTPAWFTGSRGHNQATQRKLAAAGYDSLLVGHVGEERDSALRELWRAARTPEEVVRELGNISLGRQAHHMLEAAQHFTQTTDKNRHEINIFGESRGAMTGLGILAQARRHGLAVHKAMLVAPCFETGLGQKVMQEITNQAPLELVNLLRTVGRVSFKRLVRYPSTLNPSLKSVVYELAHAPTLFRGDAGAFVDDIDTMQDIMILAFDNDIAGQRPRWRKAFADHPNVTIQSAPGAHISGIVDRRTVELTQDYLNGTARRLRAVS